MPEMRPPTGSRRPLLAQGGFSGPTSVLEGPEGFCKAFSDDYDIPSITQALGERYEIEDTYFKRHASCGQAFAAIDAILDLREEPEMAIAEIKGITIRTFRAGAVLNHQKPNTIRKAKFSIPFVVALALFKGSVGHFDFTMETLKDPEIATLAQKVVVVEDDAINARFPEKRTAIVTLEFEDGRSLNRQVDIPLGMPENSLESRGVGGQVQGPGCKCCRYREGRVDYGMCDERCPSGKYLFVDARQLRCVCRR